MMTFAYNVEWSRHDQVDGNGNLTMPAVLEGSWWPIKCTITYQKDASADIDLAIHTTVTIVNGTAVPVG